MRTEAQTLAAALFGALLGTAPLARAAEPTPIAPAQSAPPLAPAAPSDAAPATAETPTNSPAPPATAPAATAPAATAPAATAPAATAPAATAPAATAPAATAPAAPAATPTQALAVTSSPAPTSAPGVTADEVEADDGLMGSHQLHSYAQIGYRSTLVSDDGFDPFSTDDVMNHFAVTVGRVLVTQGNMSFGLGAAWDYSHDGSSVRGSPTSLDLHRLTLVPEARYHFARRFYGFGRLGAGIGLLDATLERGTEQASSSNAVTFSADASAGVAWEAIGERTGNSPQPRMWLIADAGYLFSTKADLSLDTAADAPARASTTSLGEVGLSGFTYRLTAALTY